MIELQEIGARRNNLQLVTTESIGVIFVRPETSLGVISSVPKHLHSWAHAPAADDGWGFAALLSFAEDKDVLQRQRFDSAHGHQTDGFHLFVELRHRHFVDLFDGDGGIFLPVFNERHPAIGFQ